VADSLVNPHGGQFTGVGHVLRHHVEEEVGAYPVEDVPAHLVHDWIGELHKRRDDARSAHALRRPLEPAPELARLNVNVAYLEYLRAALASMRLHEVGLPYVARADECDVECVRGDRRRLAASPTPTR